MSRHVDFLPLGSVVQVKGENAHFIILQRCIFNKDAKGKYKLFDYGSVLYPAGILNDELYYFDSDKISKVIFIGYSDEDDKKIVKNIHEYLDENDEYKFSFWDKVSTFWENSIK